MEKIKKNPKFMACIIVIVLLVMLFSSFAKAASARKAEPSVGGRNNYTKIDCVPGVTFEVNQDLANYATAVMEISEDVDFVKNASYSYKNGTDTYMLFNMSQYVVIVKKGTDFDFDNLGIEVLKTKSLNGIWFSNPKLVSLIDGKRIYEVTAQVVITNTIYNDFYGLLSTVKYNNEEWSMFVGSVNANDVNMEAIREYTVDTFAIDFSNEADDVTVYEVDIDDSLSIQVAEMEEEIVVDNINKSSAIDENNHDELHDNNSDVEEKKEPVKQTVLPSNQVRTKYHEDKAYTSNIYSMLKVGQTGYMTALDQDLGCYDEIYIRVDSKNDEDTTKKYIEEYIKTGKAYFNSSNAPLGTHWESVSYSVKHDKSKNYYTNISFVGMDGENLKHRGITYETRTYDINVNVKEMGDWYTGYISFYAVPNGCDSYVIACGDEVENIGNRAYFKVGK